MAKLLLEARDVSKAYGLRPVLACLNFDLYDGERVGLVGETARANPPFCTFWREIFFRTTG